MQRQGLLCWGQHWSWLLDGAAWRRQGSPAGVDLVLDLPVGTTVGTVRRAVRLLVDRHETLRSTFPIGADGRPVQRVWPARTPPVAVVDLPADRTEMKQALTRCLNQAWDVAVDPPVRVAVGTVESVPVIALIRIHMVAIDGVAWSLLRDEARAAVTAYSAGSEPEPAAVTWQPVDQAALEFSPRMRARNDRNLARWTDFFATSPPSALPFYWDNITGYAAGTRTLLVSRRLARACARLAGRCGASESTVLLTALALMFGAWSGQPRSVIGETVACRYLPKMRASIGRYKAVTRFVVDLPADLPFDELVGRTAAASLRAHRDSICAEGEVAMVMSRQSVRHGSRIEYPPQVNYHYYHTVGEDSPDPPSPREDGTVDVSDEDVPLPLPTVDVSHTPDGGLRVLLRCGRHLLPQGGRVFVSQLDGLVRAAADDANATVSVLAEGVRLPSFWGGPEWVSTRGSWFSLKDTGRLLCEHPDVVSAQAFVAHPDHVTAYLATRRDLLTPEDVHEYLRDRASTWPTVLLPRHYVICRQAPAEADARREHWNTQDVLAAGSGRAPSRDTPRSRSEAALGQVFTTIHPGGRPDLSCSYAELGGDFLRVPAMILGLAEAGYTGLSYQDFLGMATLAQLASRLRPDGRR